MAPACPSVHYGENITINGRSCSFWKKNGDYGKGVSHKIKFNSDCYSASPTDLTFTIDGKIIGRTDQKLVSLVTTVRLWDCGVKTGVLQEDLSSTLSPIHGITASYTLKDADDKLLAKVHKQALFSSTMEFTHPTLGPVAKASISFSGKMERAFCGGGQWNVHFTTKDQTLRGMIAKVIAWKSMIDTDRDSKGRIGRPVCNQLYWFIIVGVPILVVLIIMAILDYMRSEVEFK